MSRRKTNKEFIEEVYDLVGGEYTFLEEYVMSKTKIEVKHNTCNYKWKVQPNEFLRGSRCPKCSMKFKRSGSKRKTNKQFTSEVYELVGSQYVFLDKYKNYVTSLRVKHHVCGETYSVTPSGFFQGRRCPNCSPFAKKTTEEFKKEVENLEFGRYTLLSKYVNDSEIVVIKHKVCGQEYRVKPTNFIQGQRCPNCRYKKVSKKTRKTQEEFESDVYDLVGDEYTVQGEYRGNRKSITMTHNVCERRYKVLPGNLLSGSKCPKCRESKGEKKISRYLDIKEYHYKDEYYFEDLKVDRPLRFDFAILNKSGDVACLIEYDGEQHYRPVDIFGGLKSYLKTHRGDVMKNEYCLINEIPLLRIPYFEFDNIDTIVEDFLYKVFSNAEVELV